MRKNESKLAKIPMLNQILLQRMNIALIMGRSQVGLFFFSTNHLKQQENLKSCKSCRYPKKSYGPSKSHDDEGFLRVQRSTFQSGSLMKCCVMRRCSNQYLRCLGRRWSGLSWCCASVWRQWLKQDLAVITRSANIAHTAQVLHTLKPSHWGDTVAFTSVRYSADFFSTLADWYNCFYRTSKSCCVVDVDFWSCAHKNKTT